MLYAVVGMFPSWYGIVQIGSLVTTTIVLNMGASGITDESEQ